MQPPETLDSDTVSNYYQDGAALFSVTIERSKRIEAVNAIRDIIGEDNAMSGSAVSTAVATTSTVSQIQIISVAAVAFMLLILVLTTTSWLEPLVVLGSLGVAILINSGSNLIFGEISFVSNAAGSILQLAVSLDYFIFLLHRFEECRRETPDPREAMVSALCKSTMSILSSGLTTVIGFLALCLMQFQIGPDMGLVLGKGVVVSLICVFLFSPALILLTHNLLEKTRHRSFMPSFRGFGRCVTRLMIPVMLVLLVLIAPAYLGAEQNSYYYGSSHIFSANTQLGADMQAIEDVFGKSDEVQARIDALTDAQMQSDDVQNLIRQNIDVQMQSTDVRNRVEQEIENQRNGREYLDRVAEALEENGENGEAYRALSDLREKLDDVQKFYDGLRDYTDGVTDLRDGAQEMKDGTDEFRSETENINDTIREKIDDMIAEKTGSDVQVQSFIDPRNTDVENVQFVITTPSVHVSDAAEETESTGILQKIRDLFR